MSRTMIIVGSVLEAIERDENQRALVQAELVAGRN